MLRTQSRLGRPGTMGSDRKGARITLDIPIIRLATKMGYVVSANLQMTMKRHPIDYLNPILIGQI